MVWLTDIIGCFGLCWLVSMQWWCAREVIWLLYVYIRQLSCMNHSNVVLMWWQAVGYVIRCYPHILVPVPHMMACSCQCSTKLGFEPWKLGFVLVQHGGSTRGIIAIRLYKPRPTRPLWVGDETRKNRKFDRDAMTSPHLATLRSDLKPCQDFAIQLRRPWNFRCLYVSVLTPPVGHHQSRLQIELPTRVKFAECIYGRLCFTFTATAALTIQYMRSECLRHYRPSTILTPM